MNTQDQILQTLAETQAMTLQLLKERQGMHTKAPATVQTAAWLHGSLGMFSTPGLERDIVSTVVKPEGLMHVLPRFPTVMERPFFGALTGISDDIGTEPANPCDDAPTGYQKSCNLTAQFGRVARQTETIEMDKVMLRYNRGDHMDLRLAGTVIGINDFNPAGLDQSAVLNILTMAEMVQTAVRLERELCRHMWNGNPANNNLGGGYKEFPGLDRQIATGQVDAQTNTACPSLDSDVKDFNYNDVCGTTLDIVQYASALEYYLYEKARSQGVGPVRWIWSMRPQLWYELTACWPCKYNTNRCLTGQVGESVVRLDGRENISDRDRMREMLTWEVNGRSYPVVLDNCITEDSNQTTGNLNAGEFSSSIYFIPLSITGNLPVTYMEHLDYRAAAADVSLLRGTETFWTDRGIYSWAVDLLKWCWDLTVKTEQRVVLRTPQLAGKIQNVKYTPLQHLSDWDPTSPYWQDGGVSLRAQSTVYSVWL
jgi:hypothetical protein